MNPIKLSNGKILVFEEMDGEGMAGESITFLFLKVDGETVRLEDVSNLMSKSELDDSINYINYVTACNYNSTINFII